MLRKREADATRHDQVLIEGYFPHHATAAATQLRILGPNGPLSFPPTTEKERELGVKTWWTVYTNDWFRAIVNGLTPNW